jgi:hypothetical protein
VGDRIYRFYVSGCGLFPFDMLFYSQAWPASVKDAELIELACPTQAQRQVIGLASRERPSAFQWDQKKWPVQRIES